MFTSGTASNERWHGNSMNRISCHKRWNILLLWGCYFDRGWAWFTTSVMIHITNSIPFCNSAGVNGIFVTKPSLEPKGTILHKGYVMIPDINESWEQSFVLWNFALKKNSLSFVYKKHVINCDKAVLASGIAPKPSAAPQSTLFTPDSRGSSGSSNRHELRACYCHLCSFPVHSVWDTIHQTNGFWFL